MRSRLAHETGLPVREMTAAEIRSRLHGRTGSFFEQLGRLQFHRDEPEREAFLRMCDEAKAVRAGGRGA